MALQSALFRGDPKLEAAAVSDPAHILLGAKGPHVGKIQQALIQVDDADIDQDSAYGPATAAAVSAFKQKRRILNFQGRIDNIVGKKTIAALDTEMVAKEGGRGGGLLLNFIVDPSENSGVTIVPLRSGPSNPMILTAVFDSPDKQDLNADPSPSPPLTSQEAAAVKSRLNNSVSGLEGEMQLELFILAGSIGTDMFNRFKNNPLAGAPIDFDETSPLGKSVVGGTFAGNFTTFADVHAKVAQELTDLLKKQFAAGKVDINALEAKANGVVNPDDPQNRKLTLTNPAGIKTSPIVKIGVSGVLRAVIGGSFQGGVVAVKAFTADANAATFQATLVWTLTDHFGVDNDDVLSTGIFDPHGTAGQISFWILQHTKHPGHNPFVTTLTIERTVTGSLK